MRRSVGRLFWLWLCPLALGHWGTGARVGLADWLVGWVPRQDWCGRVWNQRGLQLQASVAATTKECGV